MKKFEKECVAFISGFLDAGVSAEDYVKAFAARLFRVAEEEINSRDKTVGTITEENGNNYLSAEDIEKLQRLQR